MSNIQPVVTRWKNTIQKGETYDVPSMQRESGNGTKKAEKTTSPKKKKKGRRELLRNCVWLLERMLHIEERSNEGPWLQWKHKDENEAKQK